MKKSRSFLFVLISFLFLLPVFSGPVKTYRIRKIGKAPNFIALNADGTRMYATSYGTGELLSIDLAKKIVTKSALVGTSPLGLAVSNQERTALVACKDSGTVAIVDLSSFRVLADIKVGGLPNYVALSHRGYRAYVTNYGRSREGQLHIIDVRERSVLATIKMGVSPFGIAVSPTTELVYVVIGGNNEVWVVDPDKREVINKIPVGEAPDGIAITPDGKRIFVANSRSNDLSVIDAQLNRVMVTVPVGKMPFSIAISPDGKRLFVVNAGSRNVSIFATDLSSLDAETFDVDKGPTDIKVGPDNRTIYVINELTNTLVVAETQ
jgi:YVTN family beta-propeller protein